MKICFIPIDNRPVCYNLAKDIAALDRDIELFIPQRKFLGGLKSPANTAKIKAWLNDIPQCNAVILSLDTLTYGGLIPSRRINNTFEEIKTEAESVKKILNEKHTGIHAFSSIMRISNNNFNEEEKEYWSDYGKKIFEYSYNLHKNGSADSSKIPEEILEDWLNTRKRNFEINKTYLEWQKEGFFDRLIFSKDDCAEFGLNVKEAQELEALGGYTKTGADEIPLTLLAGAINKDIRVFVEYTEPDSKNLISNYEDVSIENSVCGQLELGGFTVVSDKESADIILMVNNFRKKQGELVMGWDTEPFDKLLSLPEKPFAAADVRYANGADNCFVNQLLSKLKAQGFKNFLGYSGWNTSANTLGSLLAGVKVLYGAKNPDENAFKKLQIIRFLDDWAYQANVRGKIDKPCDISELMKPFEKTLSDIFKYDFSAQYSYPWDRRFEIEVRIEQAG